MADRNYNIDILIKARNAASQELNSVAQQIGNLEKKLDGLRNSSTNVNTRLASVSKELEKLGFAGKSAGEALDTSFSDLHERLEIIGDKTHKVRDEMNALEKSQPWKTMSEDAAKAFAEIDKVSKAMSNIKMTPAEERVLTDQLEKIFGKEALGNFNQDVLKDYAAKRVALERNANREIFSERAKLEREVANVVRQAQAGHQAQMEESLAKIAETNRRLVELGDTGIWSADQMDRAFSHALGKLDSSEFDILTKSIRAVGLASEEEAMRLEQFGTQQRIAHLEETKRNAEATRDLKQLDVVRKEVAIETERAAAKQADLEARAQQELEQMLRQTDALRRKSNLEEIASIRQKQASLQAYEQQLRSLARETEKSTVTINRSTVANTKNGDSLGFIERNASMSERSLSGLAMSLRGFQVAVAIKYAQALGSALGGLAGELVSVASSAASAGSALGGALAAGALTAIGPIILLIGTISRFAAINKALNLRQTNLLNEPHQDKNQTKQAATDTDAIASATGRLTNAQEALQDATRRLKSEREDARRRLEDLIDTEQRARLATLDSQLAFEDAQRRSRLAAQGGNAVDVAEADIGLDRASFDRSNTNLDFTRAKQDLKTARNRGVEGDPQVVAAKRAISDANRQLAAANRDLAKSQRGVAASADTVTAAEDRLKAMLDQLTPSERKLYRDFVKLQDAYKAAFRPITDIIISAFDDAIQQITPLFKNSSLLDAAEGLATAIGGSIKKITGFFAAPEQTGFLTSFIDNAKRNTGPLTDAFISLADAFIRIGVAATPVLNWLVDSFKELTGHIDDATKDTDGLNTFFAETKKDLDAWFDLMGGIWRIFKELFNASRGSGRKTIEDLAIVTERWADALKRNQDSVKKFFEDSRSVTYQLARVVAALGIEMFKAFNPDSVREFADVLIQIVIPALGNAVRIMGVFTRTLHQFLTIEIVSDAARFIATVLLMTKSVEILGSAWQRIAIIVAKFFVMFGGGARQKIIGTLIFIGAALLQLGVKFDSITKHAGLLFKVLAVGGPLLLIIGLFARLTIVLGSARLALQALLITAKLNPWGLILTGITAVVTALGLFSSGNNKVKVSADDAADALRRQKDAMRELRDMALEEADQDLALRNAKLRLAEAQINREKALKDSRADGKITKDEEITLRGTKLALEQARIDLERAKRSKKDFETDQPDKVRENTKTSQEQITKIREHKEGVKEEVKVLKDRLEKLRETDGTYRQLGPHGKRLIDNTKEIAEVEDKLKGKQDELRTSTGRLRKSVKLAGDAWIELGGNANDFGLTTSDLMQYLETSVNDGLQQFGAKKVKFAKRYVSRRVGESAAGPKGYSDGGSSDPNSKVAFATGGILPGEGLYDTVPVMAAPGEGFLTRHQMPIVDTALRMSGMMQGGLNQLFGSVSTPHYMAKGGIVPIPGQPGERIHQSILGDVLKLVSKYKLKVTDGYAPSGHAKGGEHPKGLAVDVVPGPGGNWGLVDKLAKWAEPSQGHPRSPFRWVGYTGDAGHGRGDHLHLSWLANSVMTSMLSSIPKLSLRGNPQGPMTNLIEAAANRVRRAANRFVESKASSAAGDVGISKGAGIGSGRVKNIISEAMRLVGVNSNTGAWQRMLLSRAYQESAFNPKAINLWDSNAKAGHPSQGLFQTIPSTFNAYKIPGLGGITNALANTVAAIRYMISRYGGGNQPKALAAMVARSGVGYARGGVVKGYASGGPVFRTSAVNDTFKNISQDISAITKDLKNGGGIKKALAALRDLTADNGPLAQFGEQLKNFTDRLAAKSLKSRFRMDGGTAVRLTSDLQDSRNDLENLKEERVAIRDQRGQAVKANRAADKAVVKARRDLANAKTPAQKKAAKKALAQAMAASKGTRDAVSGMDNLLAENTSNIFEQQEEVKRQEEQALDDRIGLVNSVSARRLAAADRKTSVADLLARGSVAGGLSAFRLRGSALQDRGSALSAQREGLSALLSSASGEKLEELRDSIADLDVQIQENSMALQENTDAFKTESFNQSQGRFGFLTGTLNTGVGIIKSLGELTGSNNSGIIGTLLGGNATTLSAQRESLRGQLAGFFGGNDPTAGLSGTGFISKLVSLSSMDTSGFTPAQQDLFRSLITALLETESAIVSNTQQLKDLSGSLTQSFSSTAWQLFRTAIFNGSGGLLPQYNIPQMHTGGLVTKSGIFELEAGERVTTAGGGGDNHYWNITTPTEVLDPGHIAEVMSFKLAQSKATSR